MAVGIRRIAVLRALKLGDLLCTTPAFRALRIAYPFAQIRLIGLPWASTFVRRYDSYLDGLFELPGFPGMPERPFDAPAFARFLTDIQEWGPDLVLQLHGSGELANPLAMLLGAQSTAGYYLAGQYCPDLERFIPYPAHLSEVRRHLRLLEHLSIPSQGAHKELPVYDTDRRALVEHLDGEALREPYAVVHAGASVLERRWPPERFAVVADHLAARGFRVVLTGSAEESDIVMAVQRAMRAPSINLTGCTSLGMLAALLSDAQILVSNDTGVMHISEAVRTPLVAVSFDPESWRWAPEDATRFRVLTGGNDVGVDDVLQALQEQLCRRTVVSDGAPAPAGQTSDGGRGSPARP